MRKHWRNVSHPTQVTYGLMEVTMGLMVNTKNKMDSIMMIRMQSLTHTLYPSLSWNLKTNTTVNDGCKGKMWTIKQEKPREDFWHFFAFKLPFMCIIILKYLNCLQFCIWNVHYLYFLITHYLVTFYDFVEYFLFFSTTVIKIFKTYSIHCFL